MKIRSFALAVCLVALASFGANGQVQNPNVQIQTPNIQLQPKVNPAVAKAACLSTCQKTFDDCTKAQGAESAACSRGFGACKLGCERQPAP